MATNHVTKQQPTAGLEFKASADREERHFINFLLRSLTTYQRTLPSVIGMHVQVT